MGRNDIAKDPLVGGSAAKARRVLRAHQHLAREGERQLAVYRILDGWACRYRLLPDGRRQVTALFLPGDYCDLGWIRYPVAIQPVVALTTVQGLHLACDEIVRKSSQDDEVRRALWSAALGPTYLQTEWLTNLGRKTALERLSHLFCELYQRLKNSGLTYGYQCAMPLTQIELADIAGLTPVHVNRTLQEMRSRRLIELQSKWLRILDIAALKRIALFQEAYFAS